MWVSDSHLFGGAFWIMPRSVIDFLVGRRLGSGNCTGRSSGESSSYYLLKAIKSKKF